MPDPGNAVEHAVERVQRDRIVYLAIFFALAAAVWAFAEITDEVMDREFRSFDERVLLMFRDDSDLSQAIGPFWLPEAMRDITALGGNVILTLLTLAVVVYLLLDRKYIVALITTLAVGGGILLSSVLKMSFSRPRPDLVPHNAEVFTASFPSGHSMLSTVVYLTLAALLVRAQDIRTHKAYILGVAVFVSMLVGVSRVYLGVHWPTDVLAGWCVGAAWAMIWWLIALEISYKRRRRRVLKTTSSTGDGTPS